MKYLIIVLTVFILGCSTKKSSYSFKENQKFDSINFQSQKLIYPPLKDTIFIKSPCDSLGNLKPFKQSYSTPQGKIIIEGKNNHITANIDLKGTSTDETTLTKIDKEKQVQIKEVIKKIIVPDWRLIIALICSIILNIGLIYLKFFR